MRIRVRKLAMNMTSGRIRYFDIAKGIAILCVILGHTALTARGYVPSHAADWTIAVCFSFHMALFFMLSGYFMHPERRFRWMREFRELILTYAFTACMVVLWAVIFSAWLYPDDQTRAGLRVAFDWIEAAAYGAGDFSPLTLWPVGNRIGALWFLLALFWAHLLLHAIYRLPWRPAWVALCFLIGYFSARMVWLPLSVQSGMCAVLFLYIGRLAREYKVLEWVWAHWPIWVALFAVWGCAIVWFDGFSLAMNQWGGRPVLAFLGSLCGTLCVIGIARGIDRYAAPVGGLLALAGRSSLALPCVHLVEDNVFPWGWVLPWLQATFPRVPLTLLFFVVRLVLDVALAALLYRIPVIDAWFYPQLAKARGTGSRAGDRERAGA